MGTSQEFPSPLKRFPYGTLLEKIHATVLEYSRADIHCDGGSRIPCLERMRKILESFQNLNFGLMLFPPNFNFRDRIQIQSFGQDLASLRLAVGAARLQQIDFAAQFYEAAQDTINQSARPTKLEEAQQWILEYMYHGLCRRPYQSFNCLCQASSLIDILVEESL